MPSRKFSINNTKKNFTDLSASPSNDGLEINNAENNDEGTRMSVDEEGDKMKAGILDSSNRYADMAEQEKKQELKREQARLMGYPVGTPQYNQGRNLRALENRESGKQLSEQRAAQETQRREDFWKQGKADERPEMRQAREARQAKFESEQQTQRDRTNAAIKPIRDMGFARQDAEKKRQVAMQDPNRRLSEMRMNGLGRPGRLNYAEVKGANGQTASYTRPTVAGDAAYASIQDARGEKMMNRASEQLQSSRPQSPIAPVYNASNAVDAAMGERLAQSVSAMPQVSPSQNINDPKLNLGTSTGGETPLMPQPAPAVDPNASAAISSFNKSVAQLPRSSSPAQNANLQNLQAGNNVPTMVNVPGQVASRAGQAVGSAASGLVDAVRNTRLMNPNSGRAASIRPQYESTSISGRPISTRVAAPPPSSPPPRMVAQAAASKNKNPLMAN